MEASEILQIKKYCELNLEPAGKKPTFCETCQFRPECLFLTRRAVELDWEISTMELFWEFIVKNLDKI